MPAGYKPPTPPKPDPYPGAPDWAADGLAKADAAGLIPDSFRSGWSQTTTRLAVVDATMKMLEQVGISRDAYAAARGWDLTVDPFLDVTGDKNLAFLEKAGVVSGTETAGGFIYRPNVNYTREQAAVLACNIAKAFFGVTDDEIRGGNPFTDVAGSRWSAPVLGYAVDNGIVSGTTRSDGTRTFSPGGRLPNYQTISVMYNAFEHFKTLG
jgi:hypothetical protein